MQDFSNHTIRSHQPQRVLFVVPVLAGMEALLRGGFRLKPVLRTVSRRISQQPNQPQRVSVRFFVTAIKRSNRWLALPFLLAVLASQTATAQSQLDRLYPPVVQRGSETTITAEGKLEPWPKTVICDRKDITVVCEKDKGKLKVTANKDAAPGVAWIRLHDKKSASDFVPLLIGNIAPTVETEPNNKIAEAKPLQLPAIVAGKLQKSGDIDCYRVSLKSKQTLVASVTANQVLGSPMDAVLQLTDLRGNVLLQSEDVRGVDPQIVYATKADEDLLLRIFAFPIVPTGTVGYAGSAAFVYTIDVTTGPFVDHAFSSAKSAKLFGTNLPIKVAAKQFAATSISPPTAYSETALGWNWLSASGANTITGTDVELQSLPAVAIGHISKPKEVHKFRFGAKKGTKYRAEVHSKSHGFLLDSNLRIIDAKSDKQLASNDDVSRGGYDAGVDFTAKEDGQIEVQLSDLIGGFGPRHAYELHIHESKPTCRPTLETDHHEIAAKDGTLEITITLSRQRGFNNKVSFTATSLPGGVTATPVVAESKDKTVKLKLTTKQAAAVNTAFQIIGTVLDKDGKPTKDTVEVVHEIRPTIPVKSLWLTIH